MSATFQFLFVSISAWAEISDEKKAIVDAVIGGYTNASQKLRSADVQFEVVETVTPARLKKYADMGKSENFIKMQQSRTTTQHLWIRGDNKRFETTVPYVGTTGDQDCLRQVTLTTLGTTVKHHLHKSASTEATFIIDKKGSKEDSHVTFLDFGYHGGGKPLDEFLRSKDWQITDACEADRDGEKKVLITVRPEGVPPNEGYLFKFWIDPQKGYLATRIETVLPSGTVVSELDANVEEVQPGIWLPVAGTHKTYMLEKKEDAESWVLAKIVQLKRISSDAMRLNQNIPDSVFDQRIPNPAYVIDRIKGIQYYYGDHPNSPQTSTLALLDSKIGDLVKDEKEYARLAAKTTTQPGSVVSHDAGLFQGVSERTAKSLTAAKVRRPPSVWAVAIILVSSALLAVGYMLCRKSARR